MSQYFPDQPVRDKREKTKICKLSSKDPAEMEGFPTLQDKDHCEDHCGGEDLVDEDPNQDHMTHRLIGRVLDHEDRPCMQAHSSQAHRDAACQPFASQCMVRHCSRRAVLLQGTGCVRVICQEMPSKDTSKGEK